MEFGQLRIKNFRSFVGEHTIDFGNRGAGLYFLTGQNDAEPRLGSNGAGKSSVLDALCWALYGRTTRGLRGPQVCNWAAEKGCEATLGIGAVTVHRGWSPNFLSIDDGGGGFNITQEELERDVLPLSWSAFLYAVILGQFGSFFFDLTPANKMALLADTLDIDYWTELSRRVRQHNEETKKSYTRAETRIESLAERAQTLRQEIKDYQSKSADFRNVQAHNIEVTKRYIAQLETRHNKLLEEIEQAERDIRSFKKERTTRERQVHKARADQSRVDEQLRNMEYEKRFQQQQDQQWQRMLEKLSDVVDECPYCHQKVDPDHLEREKERVKAERYEVFAELARIQSEIYQHRQHQQAAQRRVDEAQAAVEEIDSLIAGADQTRHARSYEEAQVAARLTAARAELVQEQAREDVYTAEWKRYRKALADCLKERRSLLRSLRTIQDEITKADYWIDGFKSVRLFLVEETIKFLEVETNNALTNLGLLDWRVRFALQRETKEGSVSRGFSVMVYSPTNTREVPWEAWAGGETQRLRLAGALALASLVLNANGTSSNLLMLDEPSAHLDAQGMSDILDALQYYAQHTGKQVWLIDHRSYDYADFEDELVVRKNIVGESHILSAA